MEPVLYMFHNDPTAGHFSTEKMFDKIKSQYYWPQMYDDIKLYTSHVIIANEEENTKELSLYIQFLYMNLFIKLELTLLDRCLELLKEIDI